MMKNNTCEVCGVTAEDGLCEQCDELLDRAMDHSRAFNCSLMTSLLLYFKNTAEAENAAKYLE